MPRQDVPYGGAICRLKERIAEIWDKLDEKLHSINGVEGDGAGNVEIASGDAAVVISNDQIGHRIEVALDKSKLPAASVSSVNGQTGAVQLDAADIPSNENSNVQADIDWYKMRINECFNSIATEQDDRQAADAELQTNINAARASIPEMSTTPDPYKGVERDAQGRAFAADPAAGATDKALVTANWASQTGDASPNNLIHKTGDETKYGKFTLGDVLTLYNENWETAPVTIHKWPFDSTTPPTRFETINGGSVIKDVNDRDIWNVRAYRDTDGRDVLSIDGFAYDNTSGYLHYEIGPNGYRKIDTDGRMQAADPAAGATDKTLVTANWVSQTGDGAPNNLIHRSGNETKNGKLKLTTAATGTTALEVEQASNGPIIAMRALNYDINQHETAQYYPGIYMYDMNGERVGGFYFLQTPAGNTIIVARVRNADGTLKETIVAEGNK